MKHEESLKLMELMIKLGYPANLIMLTLVHCNYNKSIGPAFLDACLEFNQNKEIQKSSKGASDGKLQRDE